jgi:hypothetical protein
VPPLRPRPDIDETREAMRRHDERVEDEPDADDEPDAAEPDEKEQDPPD